MGRVATVIVRELREALPAMIFFLILFHLLALTEAFAEGRRGVSLLRATGATIGALIVAKSILLVQALPRMKRLSGSRLKKVFTKTALFALMVLIIKTIEELVHPLLQHQPLSSAFRHLLEDTDWRLFTILSLWVLTGLFLYCLVMQLKEEVDQAHA